MATTAGIIPRPSVQEAPPPFPRYRFGHSYSLVDHGNFQLNLLPRRLSVKDNLDKVYIVSNLYSLIWDLSRLKSSLLIRCFELVVLADFLGVREKALRYFSTHQGKKWTFYRSSSSWCATSQGQQQICGLTCLLFVFFFFLLSKLIHIRSDILSTQSYCCHDFALFSFFPLWCMWVIKCF